MSKYLTPTTILQHLEKKLGYGFNELEISAEDIIENIRQESLPIFSKSFPYIIRHMIDPVKDLVPTYSNRYYLRTEYEVFGVKEVFLSNSFYGDTITAAMITSGNCSAFESQIMADIISMNKVPVTHRWFDDDCSVEIYPNGLMNSGILAELKTVHLDDFSTIPLNMRSEFLKLCLYDTQEVIYPLRHRFSSLQTAFGNIELFVDDLQNASDKKDELLERWRKNFFKSANRKKIYIY